MKVVCLVPSLTETLIECGVEVVGRTRFCVHPKDQVDAIPKVGGTKGVDWQRCVELQPDLVVFDREENLKEMAEACPFPWHATHVNSIHNIGRELRELAHKVDSSELFNLADEWDELSSRPRLEQVDWSNVPGQLAALNNTKNEYQRVEYMIWRKPWMAVNAKTFIGSMLEKIGFEDLLAQHKPLYPELDEAQVSDPDTFYLFSSEPYPFAKDQDELVKAGFNGAIVDGEVYSWFGIRSLRALSQHLDNY
jgi:hypothetical protein